METTLAWIFGVLALTSAARVNRADFPTCTMYCSCGLSANGPFAISCPKGGDTRLNVQYVPNVSVKIVCSPGMQASDFGLLDGFKLGPVSSVGLESCPVSDSLVSLLGRFNVTALNSLVVRRSNFTSKLDKVLLGGFTDISRLAITGSSGASVLPADIFRNFTNLTTLDLTGNGIMELPLGIFDTVPNLIFLELGDNRITHLNPNVFQNQTRLQMLNLWKNLLQNLTREHFANLVELESLDVHSNGLRSLPNDVFADLGALKTLSLMSNNFSTLPNGLFSGTPLLETLKITGNSVGLLLPKGFLANMTNMKIVHLSSNNISELPSDLLWGCTSLESVKINDNTLSELPDALFKDTGKLQTLDISRNRLQSLAHETFSTLTQLKVLQLGNNRLSAIPKYTFSSLAKLEELNLERNQLDLIERTAFPSSCELKKVRLSHNRLHFEERTFLGASPLDFCLKLEEIHLANNSVNQIFNDWLHLMPRLTTLNLSHNNITHIESLDILFSSSKIIVDLSSNKITHINLTWLKILVTNEQTMLGFSVQSMRKVILSNNPLQCDCHIYPLLQFMERKLNPEVYQSVELVTDGLNCTTPEDVAGVSVSKLHSTKITCEWNKDDRTGEECPRPCKCYERPYNNTLIVDCSRFGLVEAPDRLPQRPSNRTELILDNNRLLFLPNVSLPGYQSIIKLSVTNNRLARLDRASIPSRLEFLKLDHNNITLIDGATLNFLANETKLRQISMYSNPWLCDCEARDLLNFIQAQYQKVEMLQNVTCSDGRMLSQLSADDICPFSAHIIIAASITIAMLGIVIGVIAALYYRYQQEVKVWLYAHNLCLWFVTEEELDKDKHYDAFVSYSHKDEDFVVNHLVPGLEAGPTPFKLCLHYRDWIAGDWIPSQIARSVEDSRRTVVILSPNFLESVWGRMEFRAAHSQALSEGRARVIVVLYGDVGPIEELDPELRAYLSMNTYVKWGDPWFWDKLRYALPHPPELVKRGVAISKQPELRIKTLFEDKLDLMAPTTPNATTPPADKIIDPMLDANGLIIIPLKTTNGHVNLLKESNIHVNGFVKSV